MAGARGVGVEESAVRPGCRVAGTQREVATRRDSWASAPRVTCKACISHAAIVQLRGLRLCAPLPPTPAAVRS
jgi:hypothetical protein